MSEFESLPDSRDAAQQNSEVGALSEAPTCKLFKHGRPSGAPRDFADISAILQEEGTLVWFDACSPNPAELALIQQQFNLHPLSIEAATQPHERPKIEAFDHYWFLIIQATTLGATGLLFHEIAIFAGKNFLVTVRHEPPYSLEEIERRWQGHQERLDHGGGFLLYTILDTVVDEFFPVAERFQERVDELEARLFDNQPRHSEILREIFQMKKDGQRFRHAVLPMRDILNPIIRGDLTLFPDAELAYYRDVYDHSVRIIDQLDAIRDLANSALEIHLSVVANRQNEVTKQLTIIATIFLPLSFIVGFFGQNFTFLTDTIMSTRSFWILGLGSEAIAVVLLILFFKRKGWF